jgi:hypothetical protein
MPPKKPLAMADNPSILASIPLQALALPLIPFSVFGFQFSVKRLLIIHKSLLVRQAKFWRF